MTDLDLAISYISKAVVLLAIRINITQLVGLVARCLIIGSGDHSRLLMHWEHDLFRLRDRLVD